MTRRARGENVECVTTPALAAEAYPYNPNLTIESLVGVDRLRCIQDRRLAAALYEIYLMAERNSSDQARLRKRALEEGRSAVQEQERVRQLAERALAGAFGSEARFLAQHLVIDQHRNLRTDDNSLRDFERALRRLRTTP